MSAAFRLFLMAMFFVTLVQAQPKGSKDFTKKFIADSLGQNGFRDSVVTYDNTRNLVLINGISIIAWSRARVESYLGAGQPTPKTDTLVLSYTIYNKIWDDGGLLTKAILIEFKDDKVIRVDLMIAH